MCDYLPSSILAFSVPQFRSLRLISINWRWRHPSLQPTVINVPRRNCIPLPQNPSFSHSNAKALGRSEEFGFKEKLRHPFDLDTVPDDLDSVTMDSSMRNGGVNSSEMRVSSSLNFLENDEKKKKKGKGSSNEDDLFRCQGGDGLKKLRLRRGKHILKRSHLVAKQVISVHSALSLGFISQLWVDTTSWVVLVVEVKPSLLSGESERFLLQDVTQVGDVVLVKDESVMEIDFMMVGLETLVGYRVVTPDRHDIGKVRGYTLNINSGTVESLELDSFGISVIPSSLVSTYALLVEDILEVVADTVVVHEDAASRIQRLTKGFGNSRNARAFIEDELGEHSNFEELDRFDKSRRKRPSFGSKKSKKIRSKKRGTDDDDDDDDDWGLPLDFL